jgi:hypothetical protein
MWFVLSFKLELLIGDEGKEFEIFATINLILLSGKKFIHEKNLWRSETLLSERINSNTL